MFLSERLDGSWDEDKRMFPFESPLSLAAGSGPEQPPAVQPAAQDAVKSVSWTTAASGWQGREAELALQVLPCLYSLRAARNAVCKAPMLCCVLPQHQRCCRGMFDARLCFRRLTCANCRGCVCGHGGRWDG